MKRLKRLNFFPDPKKFYRLAGYLANRERHTSARIAIGFGQYDSRQWQGSIKSRGCIDSILARHAVYDEQGFERIGGCVYLTYLIHQILVDVETPRGVQYQHVATFQFGILDRAPGDLDRIFRWLAGLECGAYFAR